MISKKITSIIKNIAYTCSGIVLVCLLFVSSLSTCVIGTDADGGAHTFYVKDYPVIHLIAVFVLMGLIYCLKNKMLRYQSYDKAVWMVIGCWGILAALWVLCNTEEPMHDPANVLLASRQMRQYNFSSFTGDGYLNVWTGNRSLALFFYLISFIIGVDNYTVLRLLNVAAVMLIFLLVYQIVGKLWGKGKRIAFYSVFLCACFVPALMYTTFIYGDIYGFCLGITALYAQLKYFRGRKYSWMILSVIIMALAILLKMNCLIILIAMVGMLLYDMLLNRDWKKSLVYLVVFVIGISGIFIGSDMLLEHITGMEKPEGVPSEAWIAMGLQEGAGTAGNYNGYNRKVYVENEYDSQRTREAAREDIRESMQKFQKNPEYAVRFFVKKIASQWSNPGCGVLNNGVEKTSGLPWFINDMQSGGGKTVLRQFLNIFQVWILLGAVAYIVMRKDKTDFEWIFFLIFLGGFAFHLFWEAGSRYAFLYYLLLIPYSCMGLSSLERKVENSLKNKLKEKKLWNKRGLVIVCLLLAAVIILPYTDLPGKVVFISKEKEAEKASAVEDGYYFISPVGNNELHLTEMDDKIMLMNEDNVKQMVSICRMREHRVIRFMPSQNSLELAGGENVCPENPENAFEWQLVRTGDKENEYYILMDDKTALTYSLEDWTVRLGEFSEGDHRQIWTIAGEGGKIFAQ